MCDKNYSYFIANLEMLCEKYPSKYAVIKDETVIGVYDSFDEAYNETLKTEELGTFLIQQCVKESEATVGYFYSNNVVFA